MMTHAPTVLILLPLVLMVAFRIRRNVGRQRIRPKRMQFRIALMCIALIALGIAPPFKPEFTGAMFGGVMAGALIAWFALRHTRFELTSAGRFYYPNLYIGMTVSALLICRIAYRFLILAPAIQSAAQDHPAASPLMLYGSRTPLTLALLGLVIGYYATYYTGVLICSRRSAQLSAAAAEVPA